MTRVDRNVIVLMMQLRRILVEAPTEILREILHAILHDMAYYYSKLHAFWRWLEFPNIYRWWFRNRGYDVIRGWAGTSRQVGGNRVIARMLSGNPEDMAMSKWLRSGKVSGIHRRINII